MTNFVDSLYGSSIFYLVKENTAYEITICFMTAINVFILLVLQDVILCVSELFSTKYI